MSRKNKLKRCPFCNGKPSLLKALGLRMNIECCDCGGNIWEFQGDSEEGLIARWNRRTPIPT